MKEKIYTIPVKEAFEADCECPICMMYKELEENAIEFTMGPSYMDDDIREATSSLGFCEKHLGQLYQNQNRLGLALILESHMDKLMKEIEKRTSGGIKYSSPALFKRKAEVPQVVSYLDGVEATCFVCDKIDRSYQRYIATIFHLYHTDGAFREKFSNTKGFCTGHYRKLFSAAAGHLSGEELNRFLTELNRVYLENMKRVRDDLEWFINKFDYRYADEPWKNAKDALPRAMQKTNSII
ncbi:MAG TPA: hypothetical protein GXX75_17100 [Clostridiales bacterium]|nr:hypothetical protein [Clostridiales bacterium]